MPNSVSRMRRFQLVRTEDVSGTSGTGLIAEGIEFTSGSCVITWLTQFRTVSFYESVRALSEIHGHDGRTKIVFIDSPEEEL
jgi:hypothetical protein